jgi:polyisoprenoid-binding protein YceI
MFIPLQKSLAGQQCEPLTWQKELYVYSRQSTPRDSTWPIDPAQSSVHCKVRHMMISNVRGEFRTVRYALRVQGDLTLHF